MNLNKYLLIVAVSLIPVASYATGFSGPYVGAQFGLVNGTDKNTEQSYGSANGYTADISPKANEFGLMGGYNRTLDNDLVLGAEADYETRSGDSSTLYKNFGVPDPNFPIKTKLKAAYALRAKLGRMFNENQTLAYVSAGFAAANITRTYYDNSIPTSWENSKWQNGWTAGLGVEHLFKPNISARLEYNYADYGQAEIDSSPIYGAGTTELQKYHESSFRVGVAYRF
jgi:outer membrane immunogenic protein